MELFRRKLPRRIAIAIAAAVACFVLLGVSLSFTVPVNELLVALAASVLVGGMAPLTVTLQRRLLRGELGRFFGSELVWKQLNLVYPEFVVHAEVVRHLNAADQRLKYDKPDVSPYKRERHIDVERIVASNDIDALLHVAAIFKTVDENVSIFSSDADALNECDLSFISFGLTSNDCTLMYLDKHRDKTLFKIIDEANGVCLRLSDGTEFRNTEDDDYSVIVRYAPDPDIAGRRWFIVAGLGPRGTPAAGRYLARHWRRLRTQVRDDNKNFCAVIRTSRANFKVEHGHTIYAP